MTTIANEITTIMRGKDDVAGILIDQFGVTLLDLLNDSGVVVTPGLFTTSMVDNLPVLGSLKRLNDWKAVLENAPRYLPLSGGTMSGLIIRSEKNFPDQTANFTNAVNSALLKIPFVKSSWLPVFSAETKDGNWSLGSLPDDNNILSLQYCEKLETNSNNITKILFPKISGTLALEDPWIEFGQTYGGVSGTELRKTFWKKIAKINPTTNRESVRIEVLIQGDVNYPSDMHLSITASAFNEINSGNLTTSISAAITSGVLLKPTAAIWSPKICLTNDGEIWFNAGILWGTRVLYKLIDKSGNPSFYITPGQPWNENPGKVQFDCPNNDGEIFLNLGKRYGINGTNKGWNTYNAILSLGHTVTANDIYVDRTGVIPYNSTTDCVLSVNGSIFTSANLYAASDIRYKNVLNPLDITSDKLANIPLFDFNWKDDPDSILSGTSAQAVKEILPNIVSGEDKLALNYSVLGTISGITACKEIEKLKKRVVELENKINLLTKS